MKKKVQKMLEWFYDESDRGEQNIAECKTLYDLVERLQYRIDDLENEHMLLLRDHQKMMNAIEERIDILNEECKNV